MSKKSRVEPIICNNCDYEAQSTDLCEYCGAFICEKCDKNRSELTTDHEPEDHGSCGYSLLDDQPITIDWE